MDIDLIKHNPEGSNAYNICIVRAGESSTLYYLEAGYFGRKDNAISQPMKFDAPAQAYDAITKTIIHTLCSGSKMQIVTSVS